MSTPRLIVVMLILALLAGDVVAATSTINNNIRIFDDTLWLITFAMMGTTGLLLRRISGSIVRFSYLLLAFAGRVSASSKGR